MNRLRPGLLLGERYRLERRVASGGMADVWAAQDDVLQRSVAVREQYPDRFIDVQYEETVGDALGVVRRLYAALGIQLDDYTEQSMTQWLAANRREDRAPHHYTLEQFGFTREGIERDFADYRRGFLAPRT